MYASYPYNMVRLEYAQPLPRDNVNDNHYSRAKTTYSLWKKLGVLIREPQPGLYVLEQLFYFHNRKYSRLALIARLEAVPYSRGRVKPHEDTIAVHREDRLALLRACRANFSPIHVIYDDAGGKIQAALSGMLENNPPQAEFGDREAVFHRLWCISDPVSIGELTRALGETAIWIADGHHRYETSVRFAELYGWQVGPGARYIMAAFTSSADPGLLILPTHRMVRNIATSSPAALLPALERDFYVSPIPAPEIRVPDASGRDREPVNIVMYLGAGQKYLLTPRRTEEFPGHSAEWSRLPTVVLQEKILKPILGIAPYFLEHGEQVSYTRNEQEAIRRVDRGEFQMAFLLPPSSVQDVTRIASRGEKMPQKSTYFYPKIPAGLVINDLED